MQEPVDQDLLERDGIVLDVDADEELDYIDDLEDEHFEEPSRNEVVVAHKTGESNRPTDEVEASNSKRGPAGLPDNLDDEQLANHPRVMNLFNQFWQEKMKELGSDGMPKSRTHETYSSNKPRAKLTKQGGFIQLPPAVKSPSDTTIFAPALNKVNKRNDQNDQVIYNPRTALQNIREEDESSQNLQNAEINPLISDFVETVRIEQRQEELNLMDKERHRVSMDDPLPGYEEVKDRSSKTVVEAEKFKASIVNPGKDGNLTPAHTGQDFE